MYTVRVDRNLDGPPGEAVAYPCNQLDARLSRNDLIYLLVFQRSRPLRVAKLIRRLQTRLCCPPLVKTLLFRDRLTNMDRVWVPIYPRRVPLDPDTRSV